MKINKKRSEASHKGFPTIGAAPAPCWGVRVRLELCALHGLPRLHANPEHCLSSNFWRILLKLKT